MNLSYSFIIPVYNRPNEVRELLESLANLTYTMPFEVVIVEDGSTLVSKEVVDSYQNKLNITYLVKENSGPGDSRNYGMDKAIGNYFIILDSDCILPPEYLCIVDASLSKDFVHCFGGPDAAHTSFTQVQKAINYAMTSVLTTGGIRGGKSTINKFQPRSFNMGISKQVFDDVGGFGTIHPGEDPDLTFRIWKKGYDSRLIPEAFVYHKRRIDWQKYYTQVNKFGMVRPILNKWHPGTSKLTYWFPTVFCFTFIIACMALFFGLNYPIRIFGVYFTIILIHSWLKNSSLKIGIFSVLAVCIQFFGYGMGFLKSTFWLNFSNKNPKELFPNLFFN